MKIKLNKEILAQMISNFDCVPLFVNSCKGCPFGDVTSKYGLCISALPTDEILKIIEKDGIVYVTTD